MGLGAVGPHRGAGAGVAAPVAAASARLRSFSSGPSGAQPPRPRPIPGGARERPGKKRASHGYGRLAESPDGARTPSPAGECFEEAAALLVKRADAVCASLRGHPVAKFRLSFDIETAPSDQLHQPTEHRLPLLPPLSTGSKELLWTVAEGRPQGALPLLLRRLIGGVLRGLSPGVLI
jgi:hypothetical protein